MNDQKEPEGVEFDSTDEVLAFLRRTREANERTMALLSDEQKSIKWGSCWVRFWNGVTIFSRVMTVEELLAEEARGIGDIEDPAEHQAAVDEVAYTVATIGEAYENGYRYGWCHSTIEPGEPGSTHLANVWPISDACFAHAAENEWDLAKMRPIFQLEVENAYQGYASWARGVAVEARKARRGGGDHEPE